MFPSVLTWQNFKTLWQLCIIPNTKDSLVHETINLKTILVRSTNMSLWELVLDIIVCIYVDPGEIILSGEKKCQEIHFDLSHWRWAPHLPHLNIPEDICGY